MPDESISQSAAPARHVFVYGTLRRGGSNDITLLRPAPVWVGEARLRGALYGLGAYPGMRLEGQGGASLERGAVVVGEVYAVTPELERQLDWIEGLDPDAPAGDADEYAKREVLVEVNGRPLICFMYEIHLRHAGADALLAHGDWFQVIPRL